MSFQKEKDDEKRVWVPEQPRGIPEETPTREPDEQPEKTPEETPTREPDEQPEKAPDEQPDRELVPAGTGS